MRPRHELRPPPGISAGELRDTGKQLTKREGKHNQGAEARIICGGLTAVQLPLVDVTDVSDVPSDVCSVQQNPGQAGQSQEELWNQGGGVTQLFLFL